MSVRPGRPATHVRGAGFTLVELLVAIFITAVMFALGYGAIRQATENRDRVRSEQQRIVAVQRAVRLMTQDFAQAVPRPVRDILGSGEEPALRADARDTTLVALTRGGVAQLAGAQRPTLQRIEYRLEQGTLWRLAWPALDRTQGYEAARREVLRSLRAVRLRYLDAAGQWQEQWPPSGTGTPALRLRMRPIAVEITLDTEDYGVIVRLVEVPG
jgi:general secretion pathway protein J